jgi:hypothetical protein
MIRQRCLRPLLALLWKSGCSPKARLYSGEDLEDRLEDSYMGIGSGGRIRTYDQAINSRPLYH